jgi:cytochrome c oxidase subunit I
MSTVDHKKLGMRYIGTAFVMLLLGGIAALLMRIQLARPENTFLNPEAYDQLFTMHGTAMIFLVATPIWVGFGIFMVPLMVGARDMAFPRLNAFGYWIFLFAGLFIFSSFILGEAPDAGWFAYTPLSGPAFSQGPGLDFWALGLLFLGVSTVIGAVNFIVTILRMRAPGMSLGRMPLFIWAILVTAFAIIFAYAVLNAANVFLELERKMGMHFFDPAAGGSPLLWQHLFWIFGHPDVYIIFIPAVGLVSEVIATFSRRPVVGYYLLVMAAVLTGIISFGVWVHHMFAVGLSPLVTSFFSVSSFLIAIPAGVQIFAWLATLLSGRPWLKTPLLYIAGFIVTFVIGGLSGVMFPLVSFDQQVTDSYFVVAHFHYVLLGGSVFFPLFGAFYYWFPKMTGRLLNRALGRWNFWVMFVGFNLTFFPMHFSGLLGMPRRVYTYPGGMGWDLPNLLSTIGAFVLAAGVLLLPINILLSRRRGKLAGNNPWGGATLEWATSSPPPPYNFRDIPTVHSHVPLWESKPKGEEGKPEEVSATIEEDPSNPRHRESLAGSLFEGQPRHVIHIAEDSIAPFWAALAMGAAFVGILENMLWLIGVGLLGTLVFLIIWLWPHPTEAEKNAEVSS